MDVEIASHFSMRGLVIGIVALVVLNVMLFTLPEYVGLELTITMMATLGVLIGMYVILITEVVHRTALALFGALVMLIILFSTGALDPHDSVDFVIGSIDFNTIGLLLGMMVIVGILGETGIFQYIGIKAAKISKGNVWKLMILLAIITAVGSAFLDNVTMVLLMVPVTISVCRILNINPISLILAQIFASNIGGATTLIGDPPNIMIGSAAGIDFMTFAYHMTPEIILTMGVAILLFKIMFRKDLKQKPENVQKLQELDASKEIKDKMLLKKSAIVLGAVILMFMLHGMIGLEVSIIALGGAAILLVITGKQPQVAFRHVEWPTLLFFCGLFVIVGGVEVSGALELLAHNILEITGGDLGTTLFTIVLTSAFASAFVDNIPFTATMIPIIENISADTSFSKTLADYTYNPLWYALAFGADLGGNGTLIGASANLVAIAICEKFGYRIFFREFLIKGMPIMIITTMVAFGAFYLRVMFFS
ncbi:ArsB/NhaD family transporter [Marine Group I thaumarchaeote]|uniref:ArsB/NhaD family transporter n=1 Tax=Marine Group I thaumarchaeote TaxID=2511932 RepID=A0A7K4NRJ0_9ARCH|nr:ArsB/NhaD family transporter [Marine Group I thaumarchaeote]